MSCHYPALRPGAQHIPGPRVREAEGGTREKESRADPAAAQAKEVRQQMSGDDVWEPQKGGGITSPSEAHTGISAALSDHTPLIRGHWGHGSAGPCGYTRLPQGELTALPLGPSSQAVLLQNLALSSKFSSPLLSGSGGGTRRCPW